MSKKPKELSVCYLSREMIGIMDEMSNSGKKEEKTKKSIGFDYDFLDFSLDDLADKAKDVPPCMDELLRRYTNLVNGTAKKYIEVHPQEDLNELVIYLFNVLRRAVRIFDRDRGHFENLSKNMLKTAVMHYASRKCRDKSVEIKYFGMRVKNAAEGYLIMDSVASGEDVSEEAKLRIDMEEFQNYLTEREKEIFLLYQKGFTVRQIAEKVNLSHSHVASLIQEILKDLYVWREKDLL